MATEEPNPSEMENTEPPEAFSMVWVKMEVDDEGTVEGLDGDADGDYQNTDGEDTSKGDTSDNWTPTQAPAKRCRRKATAPKKRAPVDPDLKKFACKYCDYRAMHKNALKYHTMKHTNESPMACKFCNYTTRYPNSLKQHILGQHTDKNDPVLLSLPIYKCNQCEYSTKFKWNLAVHRRKHAVEKNFQCDMCSFASVHRYSFVKHVKRHQPKGNFMYQCDKCPFKTKYEGHISRHLAQIHKEVSEKAAKCDNCEFSTRVRWRMNMHRKQSRKESPMKCDYCDFETEFLCEIKLHKKQHIYMDRISKEHAQVDTLRNKFSDKNNYALTNNPTTSMDNLATQIPHCSSPVDNTGASILNFSSLTDNFPSPIHNSTSGHYSNMAESMTSNEIMQHKDNSSRSYPQNPTNISDDKYYILDKNSVEIDWRSIEVTEIPGVEKSFHCKQCDYTAKYKASVQRHFQRLHTNKHVKPYKCIICNFSTKTKDQISLHVKRSESEAILNCKLCEFSTYFKCQNVIHQKIHYPLKCKLCDYVCKHNFSMQEHFSIVHLGQALQCKYCDYKATGKSNLLTHEVKHTSESQLTCHLCDFQTVRRRLLQTHIKKTHPGERIQPTIIDDKKIESLKTNERQFDQQTLDNLVKNVREHIEKMANDEKTTSDHSLSKTEIDGRKIGNISVKVERENMPNQLYSVIQPQSEVNRPQSDITQPQNNAIQPQNQNNFEMRYTESVNQSNFESGLRYAESNNQNVFERW